MFKISNFYKNSRFIAIIVVIIAVISFVGFGAAQYLLDDSAEHVLKVGDQKLSVYEFQDTYQRFSNIEQYSDIDPKILRSFVLSYFTDRYLFLEQANRLGLQVSDTIVGNIIRSQFSEDGSFSYEKYQNFLSANQQTDAVYEKQIRSSYTQNMAQIFYKQIFQGFLIGLPEEKLANNYFSQRLVDVLRLKVDDSFLVNLKNAEDYYNNQKDFFAVPEKVNFNFIKFEIDSNNLAISEQEMQNFYNENLSYFYSEKRYLVWDFKFKANADSEVVLDFLERIKAKDIDVSLDQNILKDVDFLDKPQWIEETQISSNLLIALKSINKGESTIIEDELGRTHVVQFLDTQEAGARSYLESKEEIRPLLQQKRLNRKFSELVDEGKQFVNLTQMSKKFEKKILQTGWFSQNTQGDDGIINNVELKKLAFQDSLYSKEIMPILLSPNALIFVQEDAREARTLQTFDAVKQDILALLKSQDTLEKKDEKASKLESTIHNFSPTQYQEWLQENQAQYHTIYDNWVTENTYTQLDNVDGMDESILNALRIMPFNTGFVSVKKITNQLGESLLVVLRDVKSDKIAPKNLSAFNLKVKEFYLNYLFSIWKASLFQETQITVY